MAESTDIRATEQYLILHEHEVIKVKGHAWYSPNDLETGCIKPWTRYPKFLTFRLFTDVQLEHLWPSRSSRAAASSSVHVRWIRCLIHQKCHRSPSIASRLLTDHLSAVKSSVPPISTIGVCRSIVEACLGRRSVDRLISSPSFLRRSTNSSAAAEHNRTNLSTLFRHLIWDMWDPARSALWSSYIIASIGIVKVTQGQSKSAILILNHNYSAININRLIIKLVSFIYQAHLKARPICISL